MINANMLSRAFAVAALTLGILASGAAAAQEPGSRQTREFVSAAAQTDRFEMLEANTALTQSGDPQVRAFAQQMIQDHGKSSQDLESATRRSGLRPPQDGISIEQAQLLGALQSLRGADFNRAYFAQQALAHRSALTTAQGYAASGDDAAVRQVATAAMPMIAGHLEMAEQAHATMDKR